MLLFGAVLLAVPSDARAACDPFKLCDQAFRRTVPYTLRSDYSLDQKWDRIGGAIGECWDCAKESLRGNLRGGVYYGTSNRPYASSRRYYTPSRGGASR